MTEPWQVTTSPLLLRRYGKLLEELSELSGVLSRCVIQGINEVDPSSGKTNRVRLEEELSDVKAQTILIGELLNVWPSEERVGKKIRQMEEWERLLRHD